MLTRTLANGAELPALGLGTWKADSDDVERAVVEAVRAGYRHLDCAWIYGNEAAVGNAIRSLLEDGTLTREELWVTSKLWNDCHASVDVDTALRTSLEQLQLDYLDLYLIHWPVAQRRGCLLPEVPGDLLPLSDHPIAETWAALEKCVDTGLCRNLGVSNFSARKLANLLETARIAPTVDQVELHPYLAQEELLSFAHEQGIVLTAYSPLGSGDRPSTLRKPDEPVLLEDPTVREVAREHDATPAQVLIAWALQRGTATIPKSTHPERIRENLAAAQLRLDDEAMRRLGGLDRHRRYVDGSLFLLEDGPYSFESLWDEPPPGGHAA